MAQSAKRDTTAGDRSLSLSVTQLADFACRRGDLDFGGVAGPSARDGMRAHKNIQAGSTAHSEARVSVHTRINGWSVSLAGRIDLLDCEQRSLTEIKTTLVPASRVSESQRDLHWAQAMLYGWCVLRDSQWADKLPDTESLPSLTLTLLYANLLANDETRLHRETTPTELDDFAETALSRYVRWVELVELKRESTRRSARSLPFPHGDFRRGQRDMAAAVFRTVRDREALIVEAPTGIGKTVSALFPAVKALGEGLASQIVYLTAKTSGRSSALQAVQQMQDKGLSCSCVIIRSKQATCFCSNGRVERDDHGQCPMTQGFFDRLPDAREELFERGDMLPKALDDVAWNHQLCPFELALQLLPWVSLVVCDFNYVFDPLVRLGHFSESRRDTALLVDEGHNLLDRSREMFSARLSREASRDAARQCRSSHPALAARLDAVADALLRHARTQQEEVLVSESAPAGLRVGIGKAVELMMESMNSGPVLSDELFDLFKEYCRYLAIRDLYGDTHRSLTRVVRQGGFRQVEIKLRCLDAADALSAEMRLFGSSLMFSATLRPPEFYRDSLGMPADTRYLQLESPFPESHARQLVVTHINTRYAQRQTSASDLVHLLAAVTRYREGNYMVFFPSYAYLQSIHEQFRQAHPDVRTWIQTPGTSLSEQSALLDDLLGDSAEPTCGLGFAILGGVFAEGVDYVGERLIGAVVVGIGLPGVGTEQELIADHYRALGLDGFDYAYRYPGFTRVLQTAGRVIRSEEDRGVVVLVDDRYAQPFYRRLTPAHWKPAYVQSLDELGRELDDFWSGPPSA